MADELISRQTAESALDEIIRAYIAEKSYTGNFAAGVACDIRDNVIAELPSVNAIVLPCKAGDTVYVLGESVVSEIPVLQIIIDEDECFVCAIGDFRGGYYPFSAFGKTVFLTREEAEKALEGREDNG